MIIHNPILTGSFTVNGTDVSSITSSAASLTSLNSYTASQNNRNGTYATTGSNTFVGNQIITGSILGSGSLSINGCIVSTGTIIAQTINVQQVTSSIVYSCGSNIFGSAIGNTQVLTGSVGITGSLNTIGNACITSVCSPTFIGGTMSGATIYGSTAVCSPIGLFSGCVGIGGADQGYQLDVKRTSTGDSTFDTVANFYKASTHNTGLLLRLKNTIVDLAANNITGGGGPTAGMSFSVSSGGVISTALTITPTGIACFSNIICTPRINVQSCMSIGNIATTYARLDINQDGSSATNSVGVGCPPGLKIYADAGIAPFMVMSQTARGTMTMGLQAAAAVPANFVLGLDVCGDIMFKNQMSSYCDLSTGTSLLFICRNGNVGIGTATPLGSLNIQGLNIAQESTLTNPAGVTIGVQSNQPRISLDNGVGAANVAGNQWNIDNSAGGALRFFTAGSVKLSLSPAGIACFTCPVSVGYTATIGTQGGTDTTIIGGGSGVGSQIRMNYAGGCYNNFLAGNGDNYFNCLLGKLNAAGGVKFGSGATTLNYYESGTWTPQLYWTGGGNYCMGGINGGNYVRIGNVVSVNYHLQWFGLCGSSGFGGQLRIGGIPFVVGGYRSAGTISAISSGIGRSGTNITWHTLTADPGANFIYWIENDPAGGYSHSPSVGATGLVYSNQLTYTLQ